jgi:hypothetical protein
MQASASHPESIQVNPGGLTDGPSPTDTVGFAPYVRALAWFLISEKTRPPLTVSIEGPWGSGKSSFMLQLEKAVATVSLVQNERRRKRTPLVDASDVYCVRFNAWRNDKDEALWASFAITFMTQLAQKISFRRRVFSNVKLLWRRVDWGAGRLQLVQLAFFATVIFSVALIFAFYLDPAQSPKISGVLSLAGLSAVWAAFNKIKHVFGNPLTYDLSKFVMNPRYEDKLRFQNDLPASSKVMLGRTAESTFSSTILIAAKYLAPPT